MHNSIAQTDIDSACL